MAAKGGEKEEEAPWRLRESGDSMQPGDREWLKWKKVNIEPRLEMLKRYGSVGGVRDGGRGRF